MLENLSDEQLLSYHALYKAMVECNKKHDNIKRLSYETKGAYHVVRLLLEAEQMLLTGEMDLEANVEILSQIRAGEWKREQVEAFNEDMMARLEATKEKSPLPEQADDKAVKALLLNCLEEHYGKLPETVR